MTGRKTRWKWRNSVSGLFAASEPEASGSRLELDVAEETQVVKEEKSGRSAKGSDAEAKNIGMEFLTQFLALFATVWN